MNYGPYKFHTGYLFEGLELLIRKVAYTKYDAIGLVRWSNYSKVSKNETPSSYASPTLGFPYPMTSRGYKGISQSFVWRNRTPGLEPWPLNCT
jgi:hypothetical protein